MSRVSTFRNVYFRSDILRYYLLFKKFHFRVYGVGCCFGFALNNETGLCESKDLKYIALMQNIAIDSDDEVNDSKKKLYALRYEFQ